MNIRTAFQERTKKLLDHFSSCLMPKDGVAIQLMNDFPVWTPDELAFVSLHCGLANAALERMYLKSYRLFREERIQQYKLSRGRPTVVDGAIREIEGQAYERPRPEQARQQMGGQNPFGGISPDEILEEMRKAGMGGGPSHGESFADFLKSFKRAHESGKGQTREEAMDAARRARQGRGNYTDTEKEMHEKAKQGNTNYVPNAPGYLQEHLQILELNWPITREGAKAQHRAMAKKHHPDMQGGSAERFQKIQVAWERLEEYFNVHGE